jgi:hypothetical protein
LRSVDGDGQYRAKPSDIEKYHVNLEKLDPKTGASCGDMHLEWGPSTGRTSVVPREIVIGGNDSEE